MAAAAEYHPPHVRPSVCPSIIHSRRTQMMHVLSSRIALWFMRHPNWKIVSVELSVGPVRVHFRVCLLANQTSAMAQQCSQSLSRFFIFVACFSKKLYTYIRSIFCIIIARYIINGRDTWLNWNWPRKMKILPITGLEGFALSCPICIVKKLAKYPIIKSNQLWGV